MSGHIDVSIPFGKPHLRAEVVGSTKDRTRILVLGDFTGGACQQPGTLADRRPVPIDVDNFDEVLSRMAPGIACPAIGPDREAAIVEFRSLEDFHPDHLYRTLPAFAVLRDLRRRLFDPKSFHEAAEALRVSFPALAGKNVDASPSAPAGEKDVVALGLLPGASDRAAAARSGAADEFHEWVNQLVAPYLVPAADPSQSVYLASIDEAIADLMRRVLHDPSFQAVEAIWRGLAWLVRNVTGNQGPQVFLLDVTKSELAADIERAGSNIRTSVVFKLLIDDPVSEFGEEPWSLLAGDYTFGLEPADTKLLAVMGAIASHSGGPLLAAACPQTIGCQRLDDLSDPSTWAIDAESSKRFQALRTSPVGAWLGLAMPRILLRTPYGSESDTLEEFDFEEVKDRPTRDDFLWGSPALACAILAGRHHAPDGRSALFSGIGGELEDIPFYIYNEAGQPEMMPCTEGRLTEQAALALLDRGIMPLASHKNQNIVTIPQLRLLADDTG